jgi:hypothetical protein
VAASTADIATSRFRGRWISDRGGAMCAAKYRFASRKSSHRARLRIAQVIAAACDESPRFEMNQ